MMRGDEMEYTDLKELQDVFFFGLIEPEVNQLRLSFVKAKLVI